MSKKGGHHGGAWKVAYADFVTAMMALFLVLWLTAQDRKIREAVERAFRNPFSSPTPMGGGLIDRPQQPNSKEGGSSQTPTSKVEMEMLVKLSDDLAKILKQNPEDPYNPVKLEITPDGLRINIFDRSLRPIFETGTVKFTQYGTWVFETVSWPIARYKNLRIELEGHTESSYKPAREDYSGWELSTDRANAARRKLLDNGVDVEQIYKVTGYSDTQPLPDIPKAAETHRRVTVLLKLGGHKQAKSS